MSSVALKQQLVVRAQELIQQLSNSIDNRGCLMIRDDFAEHLTATFRNLENALKGASSKEKIGVLGSCMVRIQQLLRSVESLSVFASSSSKELRYFSLHPFQTLTDTSPSNDNNNNNIDSSNNTASVKQQQQQQQNQRNSLRQLQLDLCPPSTVRQLYEQRSSLQQLLITNAGITALAPILAPVKKSVLRRLSPLIFPDAVFAVPPPLQWQHLLVLKLSNCGLCKIDAALHFFPRIHTLDLSHNSIVHVVHLQDCIDLKLLDLSFNRIRVLSNLERVLGSVTFLNVSYNEIQSLDGVDKVYSLQHLNAERNFVDDFAEVGHCCRLPCLEQLQLAGNPLADSNNSNGDSSSSYSRYISSSYTSSSSSSNNGSSSSNGDNTCYRLRVFSEFIRDGSVLSKGRSFPALDGKPMLKREKQLLRRIMFRSAGAAADAQVDFSHPGDRYLRPEDELAAAAIAAAAASGNGDSCEEQEDDEDDDFDWTEASFDQEGDLTSGFDPNSEHSRSPTAAVRSSRSSSNSRNMRSRSVAARDNSSNNNSRRSNSVSSPSFNAASVVGARLSFTRSSSRSNRSAAAIAATTATSSLTATGSNSSAWLAAENRVQRSAYASPYVPRKLRLDTTTAATTAAVAVGANCGRQKRLAIIASRSQQSPLPASAAVAVATIDFDNSFKSNSNNSSSSNSSSSGSNNSSSSGSSSSSSSSSGNELVNFPSLEEIEARLREQREEFQRKHFSMVSIERLRNQLPMHNNNSNYNYSNSSSNCSSSTPTRHNGSINIDTAVVAATDESTAIESTTTASASEQLHLTISSSNSSSSSDQQTGRSLVLTPVQSSRMDQLVRNVDDAILAPEELEMRLSLQKEEEAATTAVATVDADSSLLSDSVDSTAASVSATDESLAAATAASLSFDGAIGIAIDSQGPFDTSASVADTITTTSAAAVTIASTTEVAAALGEASAVVDAMRTPSESQPELLYTGDRDYSNLSVLENLELYFKEQVFGPRRPSGNHPFLKYNNNNIINNSINSIKDSQQQQKQQQQLDASCSFVRSPSGRSERFCALFCEKILNISVHKQKQFHLLLKQQQQQQQQQLTAATEEEEVSMYIVLTDQAVYFIRRDIDPKARFCDAPLLAVEAAHALFTLCKCTIFFGFQRSIFTFAAEEAFSPMTTTTTSAAAMVFEYVVITRDKARMYPIISQIPKAANVRRSELQQHHPTTLSTATTTTTAAGAVGNVKIDNRDQELVQKILEYTASLGSDHDIVHYQMTFQTWRKRPGYRAPRSVVLTQSMLLLCTEQLHCSSSSGYGSSNGSSSGSGNGSSSSNGSSNGSSSGNNSHGSSGQLQLQVEDTADLCDVYKIVCEDNPLFVTFIFQPAKKWLLSKRRKWRLCTDSRAASARLQDACRRACAEKGNPDV